MDPIFIFFLVMLVFLYLLLIRPQRQQAKRHQEMLQNLEVGDEVITAGGIYGEITAIDDERVQLEVDADVRIAVSRKRDRQQGDAGGSRRDGRGAGDGARARDGPRARHDSGAGGRGADQPLGVPSTLRRHLLILLVLLGAIVAVVTFGYFREPTLGLDLQGGLEVVLEARPEAGQELTDADLDRSVEIIRQRIDKIGVSEPEIRKQEPNQIVVDLAGVFDAPRAAALIGQTAQLEFYDLQGDVDPRLVGRQRQPGGEPGAAPAAHAGGRTARRTRPRASGTSTGTSRSGWPGPRRRSKSSSSRSRAARRLRAPSSTSSPRTRVILTCGSTPSEGEAAVESALSGRRRREPALVLPLPVPAER